MSKICGKCKQTKSKSEFRKNNLTKDKLYHWCNDCSNEYSLNYHRNNKEELNRKKRIHHHKNRDTINEAKREYHRNNKDKRKIYLEKNKEKIKRQAIERREKNKEHLNLYRIRYKPIRNKRETERRNTDYLHNMTIRLRNRTWAAFNRQDWDKSKSTEYMMGCTYGHAVNHLEKQFTYGMTWANREHWHIDHIVPLSSASTIKELKQLCHYTNLQPLWAIDNLRKSDKII